MGGARFRKRKENEKISRKEGKVFILQNDLCV